MAKTYIYDEKRGLPFVMDVSENPQALDTWYPANEQQVEEALLRHGAVLLRGFDVGSTERFQQALQAVGGPLLDYVDGNSPRTKQSKGVYTSTEYPAEHWISMHNELSYCANWPSRLFFCCITAPQSGGSTTVADCRAVLNDLDPALVERFETRGVRYIRNLHGGYGFGPSWQDTFETEDRAAVEKFCAENQMELTWNDEEGASVVQEAPGVITHGKSGEKVWFNQADQFHPSNHPEEYREAMLELVDGDVSQLPMFATYGDGQHIDEADLDQVRNAFKEHTVAFPWEEGDLLLVDNVLAAHGRSPFEGDRRILVAMC